MKSWADPKAEQKVAAAAQAARDAERSGAGTEQDASLSSSFLEAQCGAYASFVQRMRQALTNFGGYGGHDRCRTGGGVGRGLGRGAHVFPCPSPRAGEWLNDAGVLIFLALVFFLIVFIFHFVSCVAFVFV